MNRTIVGTQTALAGSFSAAAGRYWLGVFPKVEQEVRRLRARAAEIPDPVLRRLALQNLKFERGNLDGAAAFAAFVPRGRRDAVIRAQVSFQAIYDYVDSLAEQSCAEPRRNGRRLHEALRVAVDPGARHVDYYAYNPRGDDAGYLEEVVDVCRTATRRLRSYPSVESAVGRAAERIVTYQSLSAGDILGYDALARWARTQTPPGEQLRWWEVAASAGSSLTVFALLALAAAPVVETAEVMALESAYFPWIGALHTLLDSLIDREQDVAEGRPCLLDHYRSRTEEVEHVAALAGGALDRADALPRGSQHAMILAGMASHYLSAPAAHRPDAADVTRQVLEVLGDLALPTMAILGVRRALLGTRNATTPLATFRPFGEAA